MFAVDTLGIPLTEAAFVPDGDGRDTVLLPLEELLLPPFPEYSSITMFIG